MHRIRLFLVVLVAAFAVGVMPAVAQSSGGDEPAVVLESELEDAGEEAWTFRFLVPTLILITSVAVVGVIIGYGVRVRGRYRVIK